MLARAKQATKTIPIVMVTTSGSCCGGDTSTASRAPAEISPGSPDSPDDLSGKRLELLKEAVPKISRVGISAGAEESAGKAAKEYEACRPRGTENTASILGGTNIRTHDLEERISSMQPRRERTR